MPREPFLTGLRFASPAVRLLLIAAAFLAAVGVARADDTEKRYDELTRLSRDGQLTQGAANTQWLVDEARAKFGEMSLPYARALSWQAYFSQARGRWDQAEAQFERALAIYENLRPPGHPDIATATNNLGFIYQNSDRLDQAETMYKRALALREAAVPRSDLAIAESLNNLAQCYKRQGRPAEAAPLHRRALELRLQALPAGHLSIAQSLINLGSTLELQGLFDEAVPFYEKVLELRLAALNRQHPDVAAALGKLGEIHFKRGNFAKAEPYLKDAVEIRYRTQQAGHIDIATALSARAHNLIELKRLEDAKSLLRNALAIQQVILPPLHPSIARTQALLATVARREGDTAQALALMRVAAVSQVARGKTEDLALQHYAEFVGIAWEEAIRTKAAPDSALIAEAFEMAQRAGQTDTAATITRMSSRFSARDEGLATLMQQRQRTDDDHRVLEQEYNLTIAVPLADRPRPLKAIQDDIDAAARNRTRIDIELQTRFPSYAQLIAPEALTSEQARDLLSPKDAVLMYFCGTDGMYVWALTRQASVWRKLERATSEVRNDVAALRKTLDIDGILAGGTTAALFDLGIAHGLYRTLIAPVEPVLAGRDNLIFVPCGPLTSLPPQVLVRTPPAEPSPSLRQVAEYRTADWLVNSFAISIMPSLASFRALRSIAGKSTAPLPFVGFGNPIFQAKAGSALQPGGAPSGLQTIAATQRKSYNAFWRGASVDVDALSRALVPLPETETELKQIAATLKAPPTSLYLGGAATEAQVKSTDLSRYRVVYFATHGLVAGELDGLGEPALALSRPTSASELDDGLLTASEVSRLSLNADWVILSACNTADGDAIGAEALSGLAKSFFHAGARALLVSHWRIASETTVGLSTAVFAATAADPKLSKAQALRQAMRLTMANEKDPWSGYPTFWAPFVVVGDSG